MIQVSNGNVVSTLKLMDVLHVPKLGGNLLSIPRITDKNLNVILDDERARVLNSDGEVILIGMKKGRLYRCCEIL